MCNLNEARNTAQNEVRRIIAADSELNNSEVEEMRLAHENELAWIFTADIPKLIKDGWSPGAITVCIDKKDGHVLTDEEQSDLHKNWDKNRRRAGFLKQK